VGRGVVLLSKDQEKTAAASLSYPQIMTIRLMASARRAAFMAGTMITWASAVKPRPQRTKSACRRSRNQAIMWRRRRLSEAVALP